MRHELSEGESRWSWLVAWAGLTVITVTVRLIASEREVAKLRRIGQLGEEFLDGVTVARLIREPVPFTCLSGGEARELRAKIQARYDKLDLDMREADRLGTVATYA